MAYVLKVREMDKLLVYPVENHPQASRITINKPETPIQTLTKQMGTGGNNVPLILILNDMGGSHEYFIQRYINTASEHEAS